MPYKSDAQRKWFHTEAARKKGITQDMVDEYDKESEGKMLPEKVSSKMKEIVKKHLSGKKKHGKLQDIANKHLSKMHKGMMK